MGIYNRTIARHAYYTTEADAGLAPKSTELRSVDKRLAEMKVRREERDRDNRRAGEREHDMIEKIVRKATKHDSATKIDKLSVIIKMKEDGNITEEEFQKLKGELI